MDPLEKDIKNIEKNRINVYQACLEEFSELDYNDPYLEQIKQDIKRLEKKTEQK